MAAAGSRPAAGVFTPAHPWGIMQAQVMGGAIRCNPCLAIRRSLVDSWAVVSTERRLYGGT